MDWTGLKSILRCGPNNSSQIYPYCNSYIFKLGIQKVSFKLQNWYKKKPKITSQIKTQVAEQNFIYLFIIIIIIIIIIIKGDDLITFFLLFLCQLSLAYKSFLTYKTKKNFNQQQNSIKIRLNMQI